MVHLAEAGSDRRARLRVSVETGRCLLAEGVDLPSAASRVAATLVDLMRQLDATPNALLLTRHDATLSAHLRSATSQGETDLEVDPDTGLLLAARLRLPIVVTLEAMTGQMAAESSSDSEPEPPSVPAAFRDFLATLPLEDD